MADNARYLGAGASSMDASYGGTAAGRDVLQMTSVDNSVHNTLDAELAAKSMDTVARMASMSLAGANDIAYSAMSASDRAMRNAADAVNTANGGQTTQKTIYIIGGVLIVGLIGAVMIFKPK